VSPKSLLEGTRKTSLKGNELERGGSYHSEKGAKARSVVHVPPGIRYIGPLIRQASTVKEVSATVGGGKGVNVSWVTWSPATKRRLGGDHLWVRVTLLVVRAREAHKKLL